jgi:hypothetical protein
LISCEEVHEILDAYALGAVDAAEAGAIEEHVAGCVRCWEELTKAQRTAALVALTSPISEAPAGLESRIMAAAEEGRLPVEVAPASRRIRWGWPAAAGALGVAAAAALAFASLLQIQMNDLENDKDELARQLESTQDFVQEQGQVISISAAGDSQKLVMKRVAAPEGTWGEYFWSRSAGGGFIVCHDMPALPEGEVYQAWFELDGKSVSAGTFVPREDGGCAYPMDPEEPVRGPDSVGVSQEVAGGSDSPSGAWLIYAPFGRD